MITFEEAFEASPDAVAIIEVGPGEAAYGIIRYVNSAFLHLYQAARSQLVDKKAVDFFAGQIDENDLRTTGEGLATGRSFRQSRRHRQPDGSVVYLEISFGRIARTSGAQSLWIVISRDVTQTRALHEQVALMTAAIDQARDPIAIFELQGDASWHFSFVNSAFNAVLGYTSEELVGRTSDCIMAESMDRPRLERLRSRLRNGHPLHDEIHLRAKNGTVFTFEANSRPLLQRPSQHSLHTVVIYRDVTLRKRREADLQYNADHDSLTGLQNRRFFEGHLSECCKDSKSSKPAVLIFIDLDGFKAINDAFGHAAGDRVLKLAATTMRRSSREDDIVARWGGDEFVVLLLEATLDNAHHTAEHLLTAILSVMENAGIRVGASLGLTAVTSSAAETIARADQACYLAKRSGGNRIHVASGMPLQP